MSYLRALAITLVVISHISFILFDGNDLRCFSFGPYICNYIPIFQYLFYVIGKIGLNIFFIISGFLIVHSGKKYTRKLFFINRLFRFIPTYWIALILCYLLQYVSYKYWNASVEFHSWKNIISSFYFYDLFFRNTHFSILGITWTLGLEFIFYGIYIIFKPLFKKQHLIILSINYIICILFLIYISNLTYNQNIKSVIQYLSVIYSGVLIYFNKYLYGFIFLITTSWLVIPHMYFIKYSIISIFCSIISFTIVLVIRELEYSIDQLSTHYITYIITFIKEISYPLYLIHLVFICTIYTFAFHTGHIYLYFITFPILIMISRALNLYVEKPFIDLFYKIFNINRLNKP